MRANKKHLLQLFLATLSISAMTVGGGYVIVSLIKKRFVDEYGWITEEEMLDFTAIAQATPGSIAIIASQLVGSRVAGNLGAAIAVLGTILPPVIIISVVTAFYTLFQNNPYIEAALRGMQAGAAAVMADVVVTMCLAAYRQKNALQLAVMAAAFGATFVFRVNTVLVIVFGGMFGVALSAWNKKHGHKHKTRENNKGGGS